MQEQSAFSFKKLWGIKKEYRQKVYFLSLTFLLMMCCQVIWRPMKVAVFSKMVGAYMVPDAKLYSLLYVIPLILIYSKLVDWLRRHHLLYCFTVFHAIGGFIFSYFLAHPVYGLANTEVNPKRYLGWAFYFFMESFDAFFSTTFWAFADSVNSPKDARNYYGFFVSGSKIGGIVTSITLYYILKASTAVEQVALLPNALFAGSVMLLGAAFAIYSLTKRVSDDIMHGYEAAYKLEVNKDREKGSFLGAIKSSLDGLFIIVKNAYAMGIFSLVIFYEVIIAIFDYWVALHADKSTAGVGDMTAYYAFYYFLLNVIGLLISFFGTTPLLRLIGIRLSLFIFPLICMTMLTLTYFMPTASTLFIVLVALRAFNYSLNHPTREVLYIPTTKDIKFKAKTWTDAFGSRIAKSFGSFFNKTMKGASPAFAFISSLGLSYILTVMWLVIIYFLGKTLQEAIDNKQVIGQTDDAS